MDRNGFARANRCESWISLNTEPEPSLFFLVPMLVTAHSINHCQSINQSINQSFLYDRSACWWCFNPRAKSFSPFFQNPKKVAMSEIIRRQKTLAGSRHHKNDSALFVWWNFGGAAQEDGRKRSGCLGKHNNKLKYIA